MRPATIASTSSGTFTRNTEPHQKCSTRKPDTGGPSAAPPAAIPAHTAIALARSSAGNTLARIDSVEGITKAPAKPMTARAAITWPAVSLNSAITAPTRNRARPPCSASLRPKRSPSVPAVKSIPANTSE